MAADDEIAAALIGRLCARPTETAAGLQVTLVTGHPDDEVLGAGSRLPVIGRRLSIVCLTDGAPKDLRDAHAAGFADRQSYAHARRREFECAMTAARLDPCQGRFLGITDQEACFHCEEIINFLISYFDETRPDLVLTHSYEGGHPDHDAAAFCVSAAASILQRAGKKVSIGEFSSYNAGPYGGGWTTCFLPHSGSREITVHLSEEEQALKARMVDCYVSQRWIKDVFPRTVERFRPMPRYDFARAPHQGELFYEHFNWGVTGLQWRVLVCQALRNLGIRQ